ncbi:MAG: TRAP transporter permease [Synergistaceae bacterium]|jgi:TRAP transporter 4TM/12TM fusion protein|nr:TRAP transporter permease [Synergistaceae bacterium]
MESNSQHEPVLRRRIRQLMALVAAGMSLFHFGTAAIGALPTMEQRSLHLCFALVLIFLKGASSRKGGFGVKDAFDVSFALIGLVATLYVYFLWDVMFMRAPFPEVADTVIGTLLVLVVLEGTRRELGAAIPILGGIFIFYALFGRMIPFKAISHRGYSFARVIGNLAQASEGIYGQVLGVSATYIFLFVLFGAFLEHSGASQFFVDLSMAFFGRSRGGPAKVGTVASGLFGMVSGSAVANVMAVGPFTIPMMTRLGYAPQFSGGVISVAGTGGQFMPPVMGAAAFIIAETLAIPYMSVVKAAFIPAVLYYVALWFIVDLRAQKNKIQTLPAEQIPDWKKVFFKGAYLAIPVLLLVYCLAALMWSPIKSGFWSIISLIVVSSLKKETRLTPGKFYRVLAEGAMGSLSVAIVCAAAGVIIGILSLTGLSLKFSQLLIDLSMGIQPILLLLTMIAGLILGMGMTTTSVYIVLSVLVAPALTRMGVLPIAAHLFVFYFGILSAITPPVATASYAAASITKTSPTELGFEGWRIGLAGYVIPFMFIYSPTLLMEGSVVDIVQSFVTSLIGIYALAAAVEGYLYAKLNTSLRLMLGVASLLLIDARITTDVVGAFLFFAIFFYTRASRSRA